MINKDKQYRTRDGREVRIYATDGRVNENEIHGAIKLDAGWCITTWRSDGVNGQTIHDLIEVKPRHKRTVWINLYETDGGTAFASKKYADLCAASRIACIKVDLDFEEGEGL